MPWDDKIIALPTAFTDMLDAPQTSDEVALKGGAITIPANGTIDLTMAVREPSTTVPVTVTVFVNGIQYSEVTNLANLTGNTFFVNYAASRVRFATTEAGKQITKLEYQNWGTQNRSKHTIDAYEALKAIRTVGKAFFDALEANAKLQIKLTAADLTALNTTYPPAQYAGADAYVAGVRYYCNGTAWIKFEDIVTSGTVPVVTQITPAANAVNINKASVVSIKFNQNMDGDDLLTKLSVKNKSGAVLTGTFSFRDKNNQSVASSSAKIREVIFDPAEITDPTVAATTAAVTDTTPYSTLPAGTYYVTYAWKNAAGQTLPCTTRASVAIASGQRLTVQVPAFPTNVTAADIYIGTVSGSETKQGTIGASGGTHSQSTALAAGTALPTENTTALAIATSPFYVELLPSDNIVGVTMAATFTSAFSCAADMLPVAATISVTNIGGDRATVNMVTPGSDFEGAVVYDIYTRNVTLGGAFTLATGHSGLTAVQFPRLVTGLNTSTNYELSVRTRDTAGQTVDSNIVAFVTSGIVDAIPAAPDAALINITNISTTGYTVQLATANQPTDPDNPTATITFDVAEDSLTNIVATGVTAAQMNTGHAVTSANTAGSSSNVYVRAVSSTSGAGSWSAAKVVTVPTNATPAATITASGASTTQMTVVGTVSGLGTGDSISTIRVAYILSGTDASADAAVTAGRYFDITVGADIAAYQGTGYTKTGLTLTAGATYTPAVRITENMNGGGTQFGSWTNGTAFTVSNTKTLSTTDSGLIFKEDFTTLNTTTIWEEIDPITELTYDTTTTPGSLRLSVTANTGNACIRTKNGIAASGATVGVVKLKNVQDAGATSAVFTIGLGPGFTSTQSRIAMAQDKRWGPSGSASGQEGNGTADVNYANWANPTTMPYANTGQTSVWKMSLAGFSIGSAIKLKAWADGSTEPSSWHATGNLNIAHTTLVDNRCVLGVSLLSGTQITEYQELYYYKGESIRVNGLIAGKFVELVDNVNTVITSGTVQTGNTFIDLSCEHFTFGVDGKTVKVKCYTDSSKATLEWETTTTANIYGGAILSVA